MKFQKKNKNNLFECKCPPHLKHLSIIMDGNGRWAQKKGWPRYFGHFHGLKTLQQVAQLCSDIQVPYLSVFAFSTENWKRSQIEVKVIMKLVHIAVQKYTQTLIEKNVRFYILGDISILDDTIRNALENLLEITKSNTGMKMIIALNYGGRNEILQAVYQIAKEVKAGQLELNDLNEKKWSQYLSSSSFPPSDLIIRTGGVYRLSNFFLWSAAYSELYFSQKFWPEFDKEELARAFDFYIKAQRRFGAVDSKEVSSS